MNRPLREYPDPRQRDWKTAHQIQQELNWMHAFSQDRNRKQKRRWNLSRFEAEAITVLTIGIIGALLVMSLLIP